MIGIKSANILALIALTFTATTLLSAEERMRAGLWEVKTTSDGKPSGTRGNTCYTPAMVQMANMPAKMLQEATEKAGAKRGCTLKDFKIDGNTMSMVKVCGARSAVISSTYSGDAFETVDTATEGGVSKVIQMNGRRIGDCK